MDALSDFEACAEVAAQTGDVAMRYLALMAGASCLRELGRSEEADVAFHDAAGVADAGALPLRWLQDVIAWTRPMSQTGMRTKSSVEPLTRRELEVLPYLPTRQSNQEIAASMSVSLNTVKHHLKSVYRKLDVSSRDEAVRVASELGLLATTANRA